MRTSVLESVGPVADQLVQLLTSGDLLQVGEVLLGIAVLCALVALVKAVFGRIPLVEKLTDGKKVSEIGADEWCEGGLVAATAGWLLILCTYPVHALPVSDTSNL